MSYISVESAQAQPSEIVYKRKYEPSQLRLEYLSVNGLNPYDGYDSSPRRQMWSSHIGQALVIAGATIRYQQTGFEREYGKYTFGSRVETDVEILRAIQRYPVGIGYDAIRLNPQTSVIYEEHHTNRIGVLEIKNHISYHQYFGFATKLNKDAMNLLYRGAPVAAGTTFAGSPLLEKTGDYKPGIQLNMCLITHPAVSEDGVGVCEDILPLLAYKTFETRTGEFGSKRWPKNVYGTREKFKAFPDIGDYIHESGLIMATTSYNVDLSPVEMSLDDMMEVDHFFDQCLYAPPGRGKVIDIIIQHDENSMKPCTPLGMEVQGKKYDDARRVYYRQILNEYNELKRARGNQLKLTPKFHNLVKEAWSVVGDHKEVIQKLNRQVPLDDWTITFVIEYENIPDIGSKITDGHGGKGVIVAKFKREEMPVDEHGVSADVIMDPLSVWGRMNPGRILEMYNNAAGYDVRYKLSQYFDIPVGDKDAEKKLEHVYRSDLNKFNAGMEYLIQYYEKVVPKQASWFRNGDYSKPFTYHMSCVIREWPVLHFPPNNDREMIDAVEMMEATEDHRPHLGPVKYRDYAGNLVTTKRPIRIASLYFILLEKTGDDWTAVSSGKVQHFGVLAQVSGIDKYSTPTKHNPTRIMGEAEVRIMEACTDDELVAEQMDRNNNPVTHRHITEMLLSAPKPANIDRIVDRSVIPFGGMKALKMVKHLLEVGGIQFKLKKWEYAKKPENWGGITSRAWLAIKRTALKVKNFFM